MEFDWIVGGLIPGKVKSKEAIERARKGNIPGELRY